jgi:glycine cleavage system H protein
MYPGNLKYSKEHQWILVDGGNVKIGITDYAQKQFGDIVLVELPEVGIKLEKGKNFGVIESVKSVSDLPSPVKGEIVGVNNEISGNPEILNKDPYNQGWIIKVKIDNPDDINGLLSAAEYEKIVESAEIK